ncbi:hypothetical protein HJC23_007884 [Cyclotella cryptica]|uniref:Uncharacterized protein n=1 Tax=Cyclotella cryptica TaxID=29204 RepID=A0ABD3R0D2_9STRA|eukprot:CCRYP_000211-RA/>CCRYP_000211-RA protein AED:0.14 eAED:0.14 QI:0/-1/0/1/-1/1/1/0/744
MTDAGFAGYDSDESDKVIKIRLSRCTLNEQLGTVTLTPSNAVATGHGDSASSRRSSSKFSKAKQSTAKVDADEIASRLIAFRSRSRERLASNYERSRTSTPRKNKTAPAPPPKQPNSILRGRSRSPVDIVALRNRAISREREREQRLELEAKSEVDSLAPRPVRVSEFNDEPYRRVESVEALPVNCDKKGRCIRHPSMRLYKKQLLGGFQLVMDSCPLCLLNSNKEEVLDDSSSLRKKERFPEERRSSLSQGLRSSLRSTQSLEQKASSANARPTTPSRPKLSRVSSGSSILYDAQDSSTVMEGGSDSLSFNSNGDMPNYNHNEPIIPLKKDNSSRSRRRYMSPVPHPELRPTRDCKRSQSLERSLSMRLSPSTRTKSALKAVSDHINVKGLRVPFDTSFLDDNQTSILERGMEKLSSLQIRSRSASRQRGNVEDVTTKSRCSSRSMADNNESVSICASTRSQQSKSKPKFDSTGRCKKHPSIIVARKKPFAKGWDIIRDSCPFCEEAASEMSTSKVNSFSGREKSPAPTRTLQRKASGGRLGDSPVTVENETRKTPAQLCRVQKMVYMTPWGETGWYTGEVDDTGKPQGHGRMRFKTGNIYEGLWINGYSEEYLEKKSRMKSGFGSNVAPWKQNPLTLPRNNGNSSPEYETMMKPPAPMPTISAPVGMPVQMVSPSSQYEGQMQFNSQWAPQCYPPFQGTQAPNMGSGMYQMAPPPFTTMVPTCYEGQPQYGSSDYSRSSSFG